MSTDKRTQYFDNLDPKALRYAEKLNAAEQIIVDAMPEILTKLVSMAKDGDVAAARYLVDRMYGRVPRLAHAPAVDQSAPFTNRDWAKARYYQEKDREQFMRECLRPQPGLLDGIALRTGPAIRRDR